MAKLYTMTVIFNNENIVDVFSASGTFIKSISNKYFTEAFINLEYLKNRALEICYTDESILQVNEWAPDETSDESAVLNIYAGVDAETGPQVILSMIPLDHLLLNDDICEILLVLADHKQRIHLLEQALNK